MPQQTAPWVAELEAAGWATVGKTNLHEFAYGVTSQNLHYGTVPNPRLPELTAGGSSGGSAAALVLGEADAAVGTDTGGSIRIPAACCGVVGFKPTYGLLSNDGIFPLAPSFDHAGPMATNVAGCISLLGIDVPEVSLADLSLAAAWGGRAPVPTTPVEFPTAEDVVPVFMREVGDVHRDLYAENGDLYGDNIRAKVERCIAVTDAEYEAGVRARAEHAEHAADVLEGFDLLVTPTLSCPVPPADVVEVDVRAAMTLYTFPFNALGWPALAIGGVQLVGRAGDDALVLAAGVALERELA